MSEARITAEGLARVAAGEISLGELGGIGEDRQYELAMLGHRLVEHGQLKQARIVFQGLLALNAKHVYSRTALGIISQLERKPEEAERHFTEALALDPNSTVALAHRGELRALQGRIPEAAADLIAAVNADPEAQSPSTLKARALVKALHEQLSLPAKPSDPK